MSEKTPEVIIAISDIKIRKTMHEGRLRAVVSITIDNAIAIHDIKLVQGDERMFVASLSPAATEIIAELGYSDRLCAVSRACSNGDC